MTEPSDPPSPEAQGEPEAVNQEVLPLGEVDSSDKRSLDPISDAFPPLPPNKAAKNDDPYAFCESLASHFLQTSDFSANNIVSILDAFPSENSARDWASLSGNSKAITVGACNRGGVTSVRDNTRRMPSVAKFLCACVKLVAPSCEFTTISVHRNLQAPLHQDSFNSSVPNVIIPVSSFKGGEVFVCTQTAPPVRSMIP